MTRGTQGAGVAAAATNLAQPSIVADGYLNVDWVAPDPTNTPRVPERTPSLKIEVSPPMTEVVEGVTKMFPLWLLPRTN